MKINQMISRRLLSSMNNYVKKIAIKKVLITIKNKWD